MYVDKKQKRWQWVVLAVLLVILAVVIHIQVNVASRQHIEEQSAAAVLAAVERSALQCYVVEGVYPPNLAYLEEHYGLQINHEDYIVSYDVFASNLPPEIRVRSREGGS